MRPMTEQNMINAFGGESMAHMRYRLFARAAENQFPNVARLWRAISEAELIHAGDHYRTLKYLDEGRVADSMGAFGPGMCSRISVCLSPVRASRSRRCTRPS